MRIYHVLAIFCFFLLFSCAKDDVTLDRATDITLENRGPQPKIDVCHYDDENNTWVLINVNLNSWPAHEGHGDVRLDDQDGDGYYPDNECGVGPMGDCDDLDAGINPGAVEICGDGIDQNCDDLDESCCPLYTYDEIIAISEQISGSFLPCCGDQWGFYWTGGQNFGVDVDDRWGCNPVDPCVPVGSLTMEQALGCKEIILDVADYLGISYIVDKDGTKTYVNNKGDGEGLSSHSN